MARSETKNPPMRIVNRKANHDYTIHDKIEVGIVLTGSEVKSIRQGSVSLAEGFARVEKDGGLYLYDIDIGPYSQAKGVNGHTPKRVRRLLAHKREIKRLQTQTDSKGSTLVPLSMYFLRGHVKVELGLVTGKKTHDRRDDIKTREAAREIQRAMSRKP